MTAATPACFLRVFELETLEHQRLFPIEDRAAEVQNALLVAEHAHAAFTLFLELENNVAFTRLFVVEFDDVVEPRATTATNADANR